MKEFFISVRWIESCLCYSTDEFKFLIYFSILTISIGFGLLVFFLWYCVHIPCFYLTELLSPPEEASIVEENETYPRALLHWNRAASQGISMPYSSNYFIFSRAINVCFHGFYETEGGKAYLLQFNISCI